MPGALTRLKTFGVVRELNYGVFRSSVLTAAQQAFLPIDATLDYSPEFYERSNINRGTLTREEGVVGATPGTASVGFELAGRSDGVVTSPPFWDELMIGCGFKSVQTSFIDIGAVGGTPPYRHGETITQTGTSATATVIHDTYSLDHDGRIYVETASITGSPNSSGVWTGNDSGATATPTSAPANAGWSWYPITLPTASIAYGSSGGAGLSAGDVITQAATGAFGVVISNAASPLVYRVYRGAFTNAGGNITSVATPANLVTPNADQILVDIATVSCALLEDGTYKGLAGAYGNFTLNGNVGEPVIATCNYSGVGSATTQGDLAPVTGISVLLKKPPVLLGNCLYFRDEDNVGFAEFDARADTLSLTLGSQIGLPKDYCEAAGIKAAVLNGRQASGSAGILKELEAQFPFTAMMLQGRVARIRQEVGFKPSHASFDGNHFVITAPGAQFTGKPSGDREGSITSNLAFNLSGGHKANVSGALGQDNEMVITWVGV